MALPPEPPSDPPPDETLAQLAASAREGDRQAAADLLRGLQDPIYRFTLSQLREPDAAAEATQETAVRLLTALRRYEARSRVTTWALGVALNVCRERRRRVAKVAADGTELDQMTHDTPSPADRLNRAEDAARLRRELDRLPDRQREVVVLRQLEGLSTAETAAAMGCSPGTVRAALWQGLRRLRERLTAPRQEASA